MKSIKPEAIKPDSLIILREIVSTLRLVVDELTSYGSDADDAIDAKNQGGNIGDEVEDGEFCPFDEFIFEIINLDAKFGQ